MAAASASARLPLAPAVYFVPQSLHQRYCWWYQVLVGKLSRLCRSSQNRFTLNSEPAKAVSRSLEAWEKAFEVQLSREWVALLNKEQLEDIYQELYHLARYLFALNALRCKREDVVNIPVAIEETVSTLMHLCPPPEDAD